MTAKRRRRRFLKKPHTPVEFLYRFTTNKGSVDILAETREKAQLKFQEKYGYWPS